MVAVGCILCSLLWESQEKDHAQGGRHELMNTCGFTPAEKQGRIMGKRALVYKSNLTTSFTVPSKLLNTARLCFPSVHSQVKTDHAVTSTQIATNPADQTCEAWVKSQLKHYTNSSMSFGILPHTSLRIPLGRCGLLAPHPASLHSTLTRYALITVL